MIAEETRLELNFARSLSQNQAYEWGKNPLSFSPSLSVEADELESATKSR